MTPLDVTGAPQTLHDVADAVARNAAANAERLSDLVSIPSISAAGHDPSQVNRSADATADLLRATGLPDVRTIRVSGSPPYVFGSWTQAGPEAPTVLLYAHHDVQPVPTADRWTSPPFQPEVRDGRLYARGATDDKGGVIVHVAALEAWLTTRGRLPVNVKVIVEGEEEVGSPHLDAFLAEHATTIAADAVIVCDLENPSVGWPGLTYLLRGLCEVYVTVRALRNPVHSMYSGAAPDALSGLLAALASLKDERGDIAVAGVADDVREPSEPERALMAAFADATGDPLHGLLLEGVGTVGDPALTLHERMWMRPALTVVGIDVPSVREATNQLPADASAKISIRLAPGQDPRRVAELVAGHVEAHVPWGLHCETRIGALAGGWSVDPSGAAFEAARRALTAAYGRDPALLGVGGTIPFVTKIASALGAPCLLTAVGDPECRAHGEDESIDLGDLARASLAEALLLDELAGALST